MINEREIEKTIKFMKWRNVKTQDLLLMGPYNDQFLALTYMTGIKNFGHGHDPNAIFLV